MATKVIDVSKHQGVIDWAKVKADGVQAAIIRAGYGREITQKDPYFERNYAGAKAAGLPVGCYWYSYADTVARVKQEAQTCLQAIKGKVFEYGVWFDQEYEPTILALTDAQRTELVKTFCQIIEAAGYYTGLYCSREFLRVHLLPAELAHLDLWVAAYSSTPGDVALPYGIWQYTSSGTVAGIAGRVDMNWAYKDYPAITAGKATAADKAPTADPTGDFIREVQAAIGVTVDGIVGPKTRAALPTISALRNRKHKAVKPLQARLIALGYSCGKKGADGIVGWHTVSAVRAYQKANGLTADGVVGQKTWARLLGI